MEYRASTDYKSLPRNIGSSATGVRKEETLTKMTEMLFYPELVGMSCRWMEKLGFGQTGLLKDSEGQERADEP